ncbi:iron complex transport system substrate-binding protein [Halopenitus persicus]|uniref:Iron complex transport system substrate-binding protein n=2 Tax=Halopenitus persicus TaxID=1048396 RepID=A0A1H3ICE7_9EURY|nr:iron complex transport system substrate-binding protein [Halopenitus persicus]
MLRADAENQLAWEGERSRMDRPRLVSLAPSATALLRALGAADRLVGVTHHCDPGDADPPPERVGGWLTPDIDRVDALDPDLVITSDGLQTDVVTALEDRGHHVRHHEPGTLPEVIESAATIGEAIGRPAAGTRLANDLRNRIEAVETSIETFLDAESVDRPVVYCEEWSDPPMAAGNWVPDVVEAAGGRYPFVDAGERSREVDRETVERHDPDHVVLHPCGYGDRADPSVVRDRDWAIDSSVHAVNDDLLNQPGPTLVEGVERLARILHPDAFEEPSAEER